MILDSVEVCPDAVAAKRGEVETPPGPYEQTTLAVCLRYFDSFRFGGTMRASLNALASTIHRPLIFLASTCT